MPTFIIILCTVFFSPNHSRSVHDTCEIQGNNYTGYIIPLKGTEASYDPSNIYYRPSVSEVDLAEKMLASYLDIFCRNPKNWAELQINHSDSARYHYLFTSYFKGYYRQYTAYIPKKGGHKTISICLVSPDFQNRVKDKPEILKNQWAEIDDGGLVLFHAEIDLITGDVFLRDNGTE